MMHEFRLTSNQRASVFTRFIKTKILKNAYKQDTEALSNSTSAKLFFQLHFQVGTYSKALPQSFDTGGNTNTNNFDEAFEERKSRTGFLQALLGRHPIHFLTQNVDRSNILEHILFDCNKNRSERIHWLSALENDFSKIPYNTPQNMALLSVLKESTKPINERKYCNNILKLIAFGGHTFLKKNGQFVVTRRDTKRLNVSAILARHTALFLHSVYTKLKSQS